MSKRTVIPHPLYPPLSPTLPGFADLIRAHYPQAKAIGVEEFPEREVVITGFWRVVWRMLVRKSLTEFRVLHGVVTFYVLEDGPHDEEAVAEMFVAINDYRPAGVMVEVNFLSQL